ncbi:MAG TPA: hypothetical protein VLZ77_12730 [Acidimicrobiales bacterium]|nr:hypothetical protein [Acidimicrobiales bacterium]
MTVALENDVIGGELLGAHIVPIRSYAADRVCAQEGCTTRLSVYNGSDRCAAHDFHVEAVRGMPHHGTTGGVRHHHGVGKVA